MSFLPFLPSGSSPSASALRFLLLDSADFSFGAAGFLAAFSGFSAGVARCFFGGASEESFSRGRLCRSLVSSLGAGRIKPHFLFLRRGDSSHCLLFVSTLFLTLAVAGGALGLVLLVIALVLVLDVLADGFQNALAGGALRSQLVSQKRGEGEGGAHSTSSALMESFLLEKKACRRANSERSIPLSKMSFSPPCWLAEAFNLKRRSKFLEAGLGEGEAVRRAGIGRGGVYRRGR